MSKLLALAICLLSTLAWGQNVYPPVIPPGASLLPLNNTWTGTNTYVNNPTFQSCTAGYMVLGGGASPISCVAFGTGVYSAMQLPVNSQGGLVTYGVSNLSGSAQSTTANCASGNTTVALAGAIDFANGQGISLEHCGATFSGAVPTGLAVASTGATFQGPAGATTYSYQVACVDDAGGVGAATTPVTIANGAATLGAISQTSQTLAYNKVSWTTTCPAVAVWRNQASAGYQLLGVFTDTGLGTQIYDAGFPTVTIPWLPATPPASALNDRLVTTIASGAGTTSIVVAAAPSNATTGSYARHDDGAALLTYLGSTANAVLLPGTYNFGSLTIPSTVATFSGSGPAATIMQGWNAVDPVLYGTAMPSGFTLNNLTSKSISIGRAEGILITSTSNCDISNTIISAAYGIETASDNYCNVHNNTIQLWQLFGLYEHSGQYNTFTNNNLYGTVNLAVGDGIIIATSNDDTVSINTLGGAFFGILTQGSNRTLIQGNSVVNSWREGLHVSGSGLNNSLLNNYVYGGTNSIDYCISFSDDTAPNIIQSANVVSGNTLADCGASAIAVSMIGGTSPSVAFTTITNNIMINPSATGVVGPAIFLNGSGVTYTIVNGNTLLNANGFSNWHVQELNINGTPDHTEVGTMFGIAGTSGMASLIGTGSAALTAATGTHSTGR